MVEMWWESSFGEKFGSVGVGARRVEERRGKIKPACFVLSGGKWVVGRIRETAAKPTWGLLCV
jgi:hypothetical protein